MNTPTLAGKFSIELNERQRGVVQEYYYIATKSGYIFDAELDRISTIWELASSDAVLRLWLETVDYFFSDVDESDDCFDSDKRAYFQEYLEAQISRKIDNLLLSPSVENQHVATRILFECPNGKHQFFMSDVDGSGIHLSDLRGQVCKRCNRPLDEHIVRYQDGT